jgi:hypothetical protein
MNSLVRKSDVVGTVHRMGEEVEEIDEDMVSTTPGRVGGLLATGATY